MTDQQPTPVADTPVDPTIASLIDADHKATIEYINRPVGEIQDDIQSYFALVRDDASVQFVTKYRSCGPDRWLVTGAVMVV